MVTGIDTALPWLSIVGINEDGLDGLCARARGAIAGAEAVFGGRRHLELAAPLISRAVPWSSPFAESLPALLEMRGRPVCALVSGDPFWFGAGAVIARYVPAGERVVFPAVSTVSLACARLAWRVEDTVVLGLHARPLSIVRAHLRRRARLLVLVRDGQSVGALARELTAANAGASILTILEALGGPRERVTSGLAELLVDCADTQAPVCVGVEVEGSMLMPLGPGLPDEAFSHDGQLTKREIRAVTLSSLSPRGDELLWDVGAGSGSIAIEWLLAHRANRAIALEARAARAMRIRENAMTLGVPHLELQEGAAPGACVGLPEPDAIFVGGGATVPGVLETCWAALATGGRMVVNAVTLETEARLIAFSREHGGELLRIGIERAEPIGNFMGWRAAMPVVQWIGRK
jgi:precorrin-6B C5,15-methyltransferase / cobalt-precorrin-6B C5,C15-methyltransferase